MHAVIVDGDVSYPPTSGKRLRTLNLMLHVALNHRVTYVCRCEAHSDAARQAREFLGDHHIATVLVDHPVAPKAGPLFYARAGGKPGVGRALFGQFAFQPCHARHRSKGWRRGSRSIFGNLNGRAIYTPRSDCARPRNW